MPSPSPLLQGPLAEQALDAIARGLLAAPLPEDPSLGSGAAGVALLHSCLEALRPGCGHAQRSLELLKGAVACAGSQELTPGLHDGLSGIAWAVEHLHVGDEDLNEETDEVLLSLLSRRPWEGPFDLIGGLSGIAVYALERAPRPSAMAVLEAVVDRLQESATFLEGGVAWATNPLWIPQELRAGREEPEFDLGVAHGQPGAIAALAGASAWGIARARPLLDHAMAWTLAQRLLDEEATFPAALRPGTMPEGAKRSVWCYGDVGVATTLLAAATAVGEVSWESEILEIARHSARIRPPQRHVVDAPICHGAFGVGYLLQKLHRSVGGANFEEDARAWLEHGLSMRATEGGLGGFRSWFPSESGGEWREEPGFLEGAAGVGLCLGAALDPALDTSWDRVLLTSIRGPLSG